MYEYKNTNLYIIQGDITEMKVEAIVNAANNTLLGGGGVDGAIHRAGGPIVLEQCKEIGGCPTGEAKITTAGDLPSKYIIHTVGPIYIDGRNNEDKFLYRAYYNSLKLAEEYELDTIAFPSISTGVYSYPKKDAANIAIKAIIDFIDGEGKIEEVNFVLYSKKDYLLYENILNEEMKKM